MKTLKDRNAEDNMVTDKSKVFNIIIRIFFAISFSANIFLLYSLDKDCKTEGKLLKDLEQFRIDNANLREDYKKLYNSIVIYKTEYMHSEKNYDDVYEEGKER